MNALTPSLQVALVRRDWRALGRRRLASTPLLSLSRGFAGVQDHLHDEIWSFQLWHVTRSRKKLKPCRADSSGIGLSIGGLDNPIARAPHHQGRYGDPAKTIEQGGVGHRWSSRIDPQDCSIGSHDCLLGFADGGWIDTEWRRIVERQCLDLG